MYLCLALLMGGGLVFFGIGGATNGGLFDALKGGSGTVDTKAYEKKVTKLKRAVALSPKDPVKLAALVRAQAQQANVVGYDQNTNGYTAKGIVLLTAAAASWQKYLDLKPAKPDDGVAGLMVNAYGPAGLNESRGVVQALQAKIAGRGGNAALYSQLAELAYVDGNVRQSVIAEKRALALAPKARRKIIQAEIAASRKRTDKANLAALQNQATTQRPATPGPTSTTTTPTSTSSGG